MLIDFSVFDSLFQLIDLFSDIIFSMVKKKIEWVIYSAVEN